MKKQAILITIASIVLATIAVIYLHSQEQTVPEVEQVRNNPDFGAFNIGIYRMIASNYFKDKNSVEYEYETYMEKPAEFFAVADAQAAGKGWQTVESDELKRKLTKKTDFGTAKGIDTVVTLEYILEGNRVYVLVEYGGEVRSLRAKRSNLKTN